MSHVNEDYHWRNYYGELSNNLKEDLVKALILLDNKDDKIGYRGSSFIREIKEKYNLEKI